MDRRRPRFTSSIVTKVFIGASGLALVIYLFIHIAGNLIVFAGPAAFNRYAFTLESQAVLPIIELLLLGLFLVHIYNTIRNFMANRRARPVPYVLKRRAGTPSRKSFASSTMIVSGLWLLVFLIIHVRAFHEGWGVEYQWAEGGRDLYRQEMETFSNPLVVAFYVLSMGVVGTHLWHGITSGCQSLGLDPVRWSPRTLAAGKAVATVVALMFAFIAVWAFTTGGVR